MKMERGKLASPCPRAASLHDVGEMISVNQIFQRRTFPNLRALCVSYEYKNLFVAKAESNRHPCALHYLTHNLKQLLSRDSGCKPTLPFPCVVHHCMAQGISYHEIFCLVYARMFRNLRAYIFLITYAT